MARVLLLGSGGREHTIAMHLSKSNNVSKIFIAPGNAGTSKENKCENLELNIKSGYAISTWCETNCISLVVVGPEEPLLLGVADSLKEKNIPCFGPSAAAAQLEGSKQFGKEVMQRCNIATAKYVAFSDLDLALNYLKSASENMRIIKADGLAAGKGVVVAQSLSEAETVVEDMLNAQNPKFGCASSKIIIEEELQGPEISILAFTDGVNVHCFPPSQDHKRIFDGDTGSNTGGMGAYCPCDLIDKDTFRSIEVNIVQKIVDHMRESGTPYQGILYVGLMMTEFGPYVLEFNCRFGDPEAQVLLPMLKTDLFEVMMACSTFGGMKDMKIEFYDNLYALCIVLVSGGYPESFAKGYPINGLDKKYNHVDIIHSGTILNAESGRIVTNGGRVLCVVAVCEKLQFSYNLAMSVANAIEFENRFYRTDIGHKALVRSSGNNFTYAYAGVNICAGDELVEHIKSIVGSTNRTGTVSHIGQFGAVFDLKKCKYKDPLLVSGTDGVGTKLKIALQLNKHDTVGQDLVAMCVNDILCHGAEPLFFLDYFASGKLELPIARSVLSGIAAACEMAGCSLIGGETAEMPGMYVNQDYDLAGFVVGAVEKDELLPRLSEMVSGDVVIGLESSGLHSNGFSLVRKIVSKMDLNTPVPFGDTSDVTFASALLTPTTIYVKPLLKLLQESMFKHNIRSLCHITGGGLPGNLPRSMASTLQAVLDTNLWNIPSIFRWLWKHSGKDLVDFSKTFNLGIGMTLIVSADCAEDICGYLSTECAVKSSIIGHIRPMDHVTDNRVLLKNLEQSLDNGDKLFVLPKTAVVKVNVAVLISGSGTNLRALLQYSRDNPECSYNIVLVISNVDNVAGLDIARMYGVRSMVISHKSFASRTEFDKELHRVLSAEENDCKYVCLAGFMRILGKEITEKWHGRMVNIHPSLLPSFRGAHAHREVLKSGVKVTGATVHFVVTEVDSGGIIDQGTVTVLATDDEETLAERVKATVEYKIYPVALDNVTKGNCWLGADNLVQWKQ